MVQNKHHVSEKQAAAMGMLSSQTGLAAMHQILASSAQRAVYGVALQTYWRNLLQSVQIVPPLYAALHIKPQKAFEVGGT
jgi:hypothetical protein